MKRLFWLAAVLVMAYVGVKNWVAPGPFEIEKGRTFAPWDRRPEAPPVPIRTPGPSPSPPPTTISVGLADGQAIRVVAAPAPSEAPPSPAARLPPSDVADQVPRSPSPGEAVSPFRGLPYPPGKTMTLGERVRLRAAPVNAYNEAVRLARAGDRAAAIDAYGLAIRLDSSNAEAHYGLALEYARMGRLDASRREFEAALTLRPDYLEASAGLNRVASLLESRPHSR